MAAPLRIDLDGVALVSEANPSTVLAIFRARTTEGVTLLIPERGSPWPGSTSRAPSWIREGDVRLAFTPAYVGSVNWLRGSAALTGRWMDCVPRVSAGHILARLSVALLLCGAAGASRRRVQLQRLADVASDAASEPDQVTETRGCPKGQIMGEGGACTAVGIQTCAELLSIPSMGSVSPPHPAAIQGDGVRTGLCRGGNLRVRELFMDEESGLCKPSIDHCAPGRSPCSRRAAAPWASWLRRRVRRP